MRKAQLISFDFSTSSVLFLIVLALLASITLIHITGGDDTAMPLQFHYLFQNLENNLAQDPATDFMDGYRINVALLSDFADNNPSLDQHIVGNVGTALGIGLDQDAFDVCMFIRDNDNSFLPLGSNAESAIGELRNGQTCQQALDAEENPCDAYKTSTSLARPVLLDYNDPDQNRIAMMNVVVCHE